MWAAQLAGQTSLKMHLGTWRQLGFKAVCLPELRRETCNPSSMHESTVRMWASLDIWMDMMIWYMSWLLWLCCWSEEMKKCRAHMCSSQLCRGGIARKLHCQQRTKENMKTLAEACSRRQVSSAPFWPACTCRVHFKFLATNQGTPGTLVACQRIAIQVGLCPVTAAKLSEPESDATTVSSGEGGRQGPFAPGSISAAAWWSDRLKNKSLIHLESNFLSRDDILIASNWAKSCFCMLWKLQVRPGAIPLKRNPRNKKHRHSTDLEDFGKTSDSTSVPRFGAKQAHSGRVVARFCR